MSWSKWKKFGTSIIELPCDLFNLMGAIQSCDVKCHNGNSNYSYPAFYSLLVPIDLSCVKKISIKTVSTSDCTDYLSIIDNKIK